jgi:hypothetical protein
MNIEHRLSIVDRSILHRCTFTKYFNMRQQSYVFYKTFHPGGISNELSAVKNTKDLLLMFLGNCNKPQGFKMTNVKLLK